ncbi:MAG: hypothetical protein AAB539_03580 [Patescibacteria group bacterium]
MKKFLIGAAALGTTLAVLPLFAAFEAHVINVTARIENALSVPTDPINFGTVFPQEQLDRRISVKLSQSFLDEPRVDDVSYFIRQKPKCAWISADGQSMWGPTMSGHVDDGGHMSCPPEPTHRPQEVPTTGVTWDMLPLLCPYLSKHPIASSTSATGEPIFDGNDGSLNAFHQIGAMVGGHWKWNDVAGYLAKSANDIIDWWNIDLKVPCFGGYCAQDWEGFVRGINPDAIPGDYVRPIADEHKIFGCDLWVEVNGVSRAQ